MKFGHKFHFNADGKVDTWQMIIDSKLVEEMKGSGDRAAASTATIKHFHEIWVTMAAGKDVDEAVMQEAQVQFASFYAPTTTFQMNTAGPKVDGTFAEVMGVVGPYWHGFKNENIKLENIMVDALDPSWATWETLQDVTGPTGVVQKDMKFGHKFHFNADGKVDAWQMIFDSKLVEEMKGSGDRAAASTATIKHFHEIWVTMAAGKDVDEAVMQEAQVQFASFYAP